MRKYYYPYLSNQLLFFIPIIVLSFCLRLWGLDPDKSIRQYLVDHFEMTSGFPSDGATSITQTPDGYLWIVTSKGLVRFDGIKFSVIDFVKKKEIFPQETTIPITLFTDRRGILWIGSFVGLTSYDYKTGRFKTYTRTDGLSGDKVRCIKDDMRGDLWFSYMTGYIDRFSKGKFYAYNETHGIRKRINAIIEDRRGNLFFGSHESGIFYFKDGKFIKRQIPVLDGFQVNSMCEDRKGNLWVGTSSGLFCVMENNVVRYDTTNGLSGNYIVVIREDSEANLWIGTLNNGLNRLKKRSGGEIDFEKNLNVFKIFSIFEDREKNLWVGTLNSGLKRLKDGKFISYSPLENQRDKILLSLFQDSIENTWVGTLDGKLFLCRSERIIDMIEPPGFSGTGISSLAEDFDGNLWLGTNGKGVFQKKRGNFTQFNTGQGLADNQVNSITIDSSGNIWFSTSDGVSVRRHLDGDIISFTSKDGLLGKMVYNIYEDHSHNIWIAADKGITVLKSSITAKNTTNHSDRDKKENKSINVPFLTTPSKSGKTPRERFYDNINIEYYEKGIPVTCIYEDPVVKKGEGSIFWIATHGAGLKRLKFNKGTITTCNTNHGLVDNVLFQFFEDRQEYFWFMSNSGILRVSKNELNRFADGKVNRVNCTSFDTEDGMKSSEFNNQFSKHSAIQTGNEELWFVTKKGISIVKPTDIPINKTPPPVVIEELTFNRKQVLNYQASGGYVSRGTTDVGVRFTAPTFLSSQKIRFKYRLEGLEDKWTFLSPGKNRTVYYDDLPTGVYVFRVTASNADGVWNQAGASVTITLKPFYYQNPLFWISVVLFFTGTSVTSFHIFKKRANRKRRDKRYYPTTEVVWKYMKKVKYKMEVEQVYLEPDMNLTVFSNELDIHPYKLSKIINEETGKSFTDLINSYRIEEAKRILGSPKGQKIKIGELALEVGFNYHSAFFKAFKKHTGMKPNQFKKKVRQK